MEMMHTDPQKPTRFVHLVNVKAYVVSSPEQENFQDVNGQLGMFA
jgi:hypothetical protein